MSDTHTTVTIHQPHVDDLAPMYWRYPREINPQDAYLEIDLERDTADWEYDSEIGGGVPAPVWHGVRQRIPCSCSLSSAQIAQLSEELRPLIERVCAGGDSEWNGSNWVGTLTDDARDALDEIETRLGEEEAQAQVWRVGEWLSGARYDVTREYHITHETSDERLTEIADALEQEAVSDGVYLDGDVIDELTEWRETMRVDARDEE